MQEKNIRIVEFSFTEIFARIQALLDVERDSDLARILGVKPTKFGVWKSRNFVPVDLIITWCDKNGYSINYVLLGKGPLRIGASDEKRSDSIEFAQLRGQLEVCKELYRETRLEYIDRIEKILKQVEAYLSRGGAL